MANLGDWTNAYYAAHKQVNATVFSLCNALALTADPFVEAHRDDTARMKVLRSARLHEWCRAQTNLICQCPLLTGGPKCRWEKKMSRSEEKDQIYRLRTYAQGEGIGHEPYVQQLLN